MTKTAGNVAQALKAARQGNGLSQRALSQRAGVPQGHISNIERGAVDLRLSSLIAIARALDLELALVPRKTMPAVQSIVRSAIEPPMHDAAARDALRKLRLLIMTAPAVPSHFAERFTTLSHHVRALDRLRLGRADAATLDEVGNELIAFLEHMDRPKSLIKATLYLQQAATPLAELHKARMHDAAADPALAESARPAYSLDEDDHG